MDLTGEYEDRQFIVTRGDSRIAVTVARNKDTAKLGRQNRFLIDDPESKHMLAYALTKPLKFNSVYGENGVYKFVLQEVNTTDDDNQELAIADYYLHFPKNGAEPGQDAGDGQAEPTTGGRRKWL